MKNQKKPYWTQIQRERPLLLLSPLPCLPFSPSLGNSHECGKLSSLWKLETQELQMLPTPSGLGGGHGEGGGAPFARSRSVCRSVFCFAGEGRAIYDPPSFPDLPLLAWKCNPGGKLQQLLTAEYQGLSPLGCSGGEGQLCEQGLWVT